MKRLNFVSLACVILIVVAVGCASQVKNTGHSDAHARQMIQLPNPIQAMRLYDGPKLQIGQVAILVVGPGAYVTNIGARGKPMMRKLGNFFAMLPGEYGLKVDDAPAKDDDPLASYFATNSLFPRFTAEKGHVYFLKSQTSTGTTTIWDQKSKSAKIWFVSIVDVTDSCDPAYRAAYEQLR